MKLALDAGLEGVEWAAEAHLPPGDRAAAEALMMDTLLSRLSIISYAALYRITAGTEHGLGFDAILETASALQSPILRLFVGSAPLAHTDPASRGLLVEEIRRLGDRAAERGITICLSFGRGTFLETYEGARDLLSLLDHPFVRLAWEPLPGTKTEEATAAAQGFVGTTSLLLARKADRLGRSGPLAEDSEAWSQRLDAFRAGETAPKMNRFVLLGRIGEENEERLKEDASFLAAMAKEKNQKKL
jgi:hypothetical protein